LQGWGSKLLPKSNNIENIYHACIQKTGSQWVKQVFSDPDIAKKTGLRTHPQFRYEVGEFKRSFPRYTFVPGLYISHSLYKEIKKPESYRTVYVIRDPRDVVVSWYYSMKHTHTEMGNVKEHRKKINSLDENDGVEYCIRHLQLKFSFVREWWNNREDPRVYIARFEDMTEDPVAEWMDIFDHCGVSIGKDDLENVLSRYTKEKMRERDLERREGGRSHYRKDKKGWRDIFREYHADVFCSVNGNIVELLGYDWRS
jgi:hypothetical protein